MPDNRKFIVSLADRLHVEAVWYGSGTLCLSSQAGCALSCPFCASGRRGLQRNLTTEELHLQLAVCRREGIEPQRLTLSGIGEPLQNLDNLEQFMADCRRQDLPVSLTTTGAPLAHLVRLLALPHNGIMFSVHAGSDAVYRQLLPKGPGLVPLRQRLAALWPRLSGRQRRKLGVNYLLLAGVNDLPAELAALVDWLQPFPEMTLHLLSCNPVPGSIYHSPTALQTDRVHGFFRQRGINVRRANHWRRQQEGGCGTLVLGGEAIGNTAGSQPQVFRSD